VPRENWSGEWLRARLDAEGWKGADLGHGSADAPAESCGSGAVGMWPNNQGSPPSTQAVLEVAGTGGVVSRDPYIEKILGCDLPEEYKVALIRVFRDEIERARERTDRTVQRLAGQSVS
jgi:hypothetical protein